MALRLHNSGNINRIWQYLRAFEWTYYRATKKKVVILVYSVKSYCVLKMSENKEEIRYILLQKREECDSGCGHNRRNKE